MVPPTSKEELNFESEKHPAPANPFIISCLLLSLNDLPLYIYFLCFYFLN